MTGQNGDSNIQTPAASTGNTVSHFPVVLKCYDLSKGFAQMMGPLLLGMPIEAVWHTGVLCHGIEFFYGGGIQMCLPELVESTYDMHPVKIIQLGTTTKTREQIERWCLCKQDVFSASLYNLTKWNCNHFSNELCKFLFNKEQSEFGIPAEIVKQVEIIGATPGGATIISGIEMVQDQMMKYDSIFTGMSVSNAPAGEDIIEEPASPESGFEPTPTKMTCVRPLYESLSFDRLQGDGKQVFEVDKDFFPYLKALWNDGNVTNEELFEGLEVLDRLVKDISNYYNGDNKTRTAVNDIQVSDPDIQHKFLSLPAAIPILNGLGFTLIAINGHEVYRFTDIDSNSACPPNQRQYVDPLPNSSINTNDRDRCHSNKPRSQCPENVIEVLINHLVDAMAKN